MMRAVECRELGPVDRLVVVEQPSPPLGPGHVRIDVRACGVNYVDGLLVQGRYQIKPPVPFVPGMEVVGTIVELADDVVGGSDVALGDRVLANVGFGGYASEAVAHASRVQHVPAVLSDGQAATFVQSYMTAWFALRERGHVQAGETLLVLGAGSGVGLAAVDVAAALGLRVLAAASTEEKRRLALERGAEAVVDSQTDDVKARAREFGAARNGVDHLYDPVGGELGEQCLRALGENGQHLVIGFVAGIPKLPANQVLLRNRRVIGVDWGAWAGWHPDRNAALLDDVLDRIAAGTFSPVEPVTYPLEAAARALQDLADRRVAGKVALVP